MLCVWVVHGCDPGRVSDGSRLALYETLSIEYPSSIFFLAYALCLKKNVIVPLFLSFVLFLFYFRFVLFPCSRWSFLCSRCSSALFPVQQTTYRIGNHVYLNYRVWLRPDRLIM